jgi:hypothetical protein
MGGYLWIPVDTLRIDGDFFSCFFGIQNQQPTNNQPTIIQDE